jgi:hypothetical protein
MTPKEKAQQLIYAFEAFTDRDNELEFAKQCALIAIDEVLRSHHNLYVVNNKKVKFYSEVQQEIEKL